MDCSRIVSVFTVLALGAACATHAVPQEPEADTPAPAPAFLEKDLADLAGLIEGRWDNDRHVFFAEDAEMDAARIAARQHLTIQRLDADGDALVFRAERAVEGADPIVLIHTFRINPATLGLEQVSTPDEAGSDDRCVIDWTRTATGFHGGARAHHCDWMFGPGEHGAANVAELSISETEFWIETKKVDARFRRARPFECWTAVLRGAAHGDSGQGMDDWFFQRGVKLHDQGGVAVLTTDETSPRDIRLKLRDVDWPYGTNRASLTMYVHEGENERAVSYTWAEAGAERIGINLRWLQASCTYTPD